MTSKFGVHYQTTPERKPGALGDTVEIVRASRMGWVKAINPDSWSENPFTGKRVLARLWIGGDDKEAAFYRRGAAGADEYFEMLKPRYLKLKGMGILDVAAANEPQATCSYFDDAKRYIADWYTIALFERRWCELVAAGGMRPWVFSNSTGTPEMDALIVMLPAFYAAVKAGGGWEVHEYSAPGVRDGYGWYVGRIGRMLDKLAGLGFPRTTLPVFIGEGGIDGGVIRWNEPPWAGKKPRRGWRDWRDWAYTGDDCMGLTSPQGGMTHELYWRHLSWQDDGYCAIPEVVAFTPFVCNPEPMWADFTLDGSMVFRMAAKYETAEPEPAPEPLPEHETATDPETLAEKCRWWSEEITRALEAQEWERARRLHVSLTRLLYRLERRLKGYKLATAGGVGTYWLRPESEE